MKRWCCEDYGSKRKVTHEAPTPLMAESWGYAQGIGRPDRHPLQPINRKNPRAEGGFHELVSAWDRVYSGDHDVLNVL